jgi:hypothetical protein
MLVGARRRNAATDLVPQSPLHHREFAEHADGPLPGSRRGFVASGEECHHLIHHSFFTEATTLERYGANIAAIRAAFLIFFLF